MNNLVWLRNIVNPDQNIHCLKKAPQSRTVRKCLCIIDTFRTTQIHKTFRTVRFHTVPRSRTFRKVLCIINTFRTIQLHGAPRSQTLGKVLCPVSWSFRTVWLRGAFQIDRLREPGQFKKLDAHFHTVQLREIGSSGFAQFFELSSSTTSDGSKSSLYHWYFPNRSVSHSFFKK